MPGITKHFADQTKVGSLRNSRLYFAALSIIAEANTLNSSKCVVEWMLMNCTSHTRLAIKPSHSLLRETVAVIQKLYDEISIQRGT